MLIAVVSIFIQVEGNIVFLLLISILMLATITSSFFHYFRLTKVVRQLRLSVKDLIVLSERRIGLLADLKEASNVDKIKDEEHLKGYTSIYRV